MWIGPGFPFRTGDRGLFEDKADVALIEGDILQILGTRKGERVMLPLFGSSLLDLIHDSLDHVTCALIRYELIEAIEMWEPRVILDREGTTVTPDIGGQKVEAVLRYRLRPHGVAREMAVEVTREGGGGVWRA